MAAEVCCSADRRRGHRPDPDDDGRSGRGTELKLVDDDLLQAVGARLDLREPNLRAVESLAAELSTWFDVDGRPPPFEGVIDSATGVGKTYILAASIEYLAAQGTRNFAVIAPGRTILEKTVGNFSRGHAKSLLGGMEVDPVVVTADNFASASMRRAMDDPRRVKLFIFSVQALTRPTTETGRRTHKFQEGLGRAFYEHLDAQDDLVVFADEHHCYYGPSFSSAVRGLRAIASRLASRSRMPSRSFVSGSVRKAEQHAELLRSGPSLVVASPSTFSSSTQRSPTRT